MALPPARAAEVEALAARQGKTVHQALLEGLELWLEKHRPAALPEPDPAPPPRWVGGPRRPRLPFRGAEPQTS